jgi:methylamine dehydrogenase heavy chain
VPPAAIPRPVEFRRRRYTVPAEPNASLRAARRRARPRHNREEIDMAYHRWVALGAPVVGLAAALAAGTVQAQLPNETVTTVPAITAKHRVYVLDIAINHIQDGKVHVVDGDTLAYLGVLGSGFGGQSILSSDGNDLIIVTGYNSRGQRGERTDIVEVWDANTMRFKHEIEIPNKRAQALNYEGLVRLSADGRWLFVQNATPATSVTVVDMQNKTTASEIAMPGCWGIYPAQSNPNRFSALCGDGTIATVTLDASGNQGSRTITGKVFDPDADAWFMSGEQDGDRYHFASFKGNLVTVNMGGDTAAVESTWSLVPASDRKKNWRPGGYQVLALHGGKLFAAMHPDGAEGSHKNPAAEVWVYDLAKKKRIARMPGRNAIALETSSDGSKLYALDALKAEVVVYDNIGPKPKIRSTQVGETSVQMLAN